MVYKSINMIRVNYELLLNEKIEWRERMKKKIEYVLMLWIKFSAVACLWAEPALESSEPAVEFPELALTSTRFIVIFASYVQ